MNNEERAKKRFFEREIKKEQAEEEQKLLDQFACAALQALLPGCHVRGLSITMVADDAYVVARAMLKARNEQA